MRRFTQVDVFSDTLGLGNPVAVVHEADDLGEEQLAAFARWTNLSETTFLLRPTDPQADYRVRIFTPTRELPFAGHPTLGSARAWLEAGGTPHRPDRLLQQCPAGLITLQQTDGRWAFAAPPLLRAGPVDPGELAALIDGLGLRPDQVLAASWADNGPGWVALLLSDARSVLELEPPPRPIAGFGHIGLVGAYPAGSETAFELRALIEGGEDPVTGSLNAAVAEWLIGSGRAPERYVAAQGTLMQRAGRIHVAARDGRIWVGGDTVVGIAGTVAL